MSIVLESDFLAQLKQLIEQMECSILLEQRNHFGQGQIGTEWNRV